MSNKKSQSVPLRSFKEGPLPESRRVITVKFKLDVQSRQTGERKIVDLECLIRDKSQATKQVRICSRIWFDSHPEFELVDQE